MLKIKWRKKVMTVLLAIIVLILIGFVVLLMYNPGKLVPLKDKEGKIIEGQICEKTWVDVNGIQQGMFIRGENPKNPVILYLHGGPGTPMLQFISYLENEKEERLEKYFTVCYWDQRGSGMTYKKGTDPSELTVEQMIKDTHEITQYLKSRFGQEKIYLIGHSWGSYLGVKTIEKYPEDYLAHIGIGQITNQTESERLAREYMLIRAKESHNTDTIEKIEAFDPYAPDFPSLKYLIARTALLNKYGIGHLHRGVSFAEIPKTVFLFRGYTISEKINWFLGADFSMIHLFPLVLKDNLFISSTKFEIPFYITQGDYDYQVSQVLAKKYLESVEAPKKEYFAFSNSAHSPNMEEPKKFIGILRKIAEENPPE